jgi:tRNA threonylcarbamoyl adenosine modification protein YeaZ
VLVLALDTATEAVIVGLVGNAGPEQPSTVLAERVYPGGRRHGEQLMPAVLEVATAAGRALTELDAVVCGAGPGPFTGLRVGLVTAAGLGDALGVAVYGVCSLDAIAASARAAGGIAEPLLVVSDARRRELYWAAYGADGRRTAGPAVASPADLASRLDVLGVHAVAGPVAAAHAERLRLPRCPSVGADVGPTPVGLVAVAGADLLAGREPAPLEPIYLRRPDAVPPGERKQVLTAAERKPATERDPARVG